MSDRTDATPARIVRGDPSDPVRPYFEPRRVVSSAADSLLFEIASLESRRAGLAAEIQRERERMLEEVRAELAAMRAREAQDVVRQFDAQLRSLRRDGEEMLSEFRAELALQASAVAAAVLEQIGFQELAWSRDAAARLLQRLFEGQRFTSLVELRVSPDWFPSMRDAAEALNDDPASTFRIVVKERADLAPGCIEFGEHGVREWSLAEDLREFAALLPAEFEQRFARPQQRIDGTPGGRGEAGRP